MTIADGQAGVVAHRHALEKGHLIFESPDVRTALLQAMHDAFPDNGHARGPVLSSDKRLSEVESVVLAARRPSETDIIYTVGASALPETGTTEFALRSRSGHLNQLVRNLRVVVRASLESEQPLAPGDLIDLPEPWVDGATASILLVVPDTFLGVAMPRFAPGPVNFLALVPVTEPEATLVRSRGFERLLQLIEDAGLDVADPNRASAA